jgi:hypothetical protein
MTRAQGASQMAALLYGSRPEAFAALTVGQIVRTCNVSEQTAREALHKATLARRQTV